jgi:hypothetical protein
LDTTPAVVIIVLKGNETSKTMRFIPRDNKVSTVVIAVVLTLVANSLLLAAGLALLGVTPFGWASVGGSALVLIAVDNGSGK